jgi:hypothetical protein
MNREELATLKEEERQLLVETVKRLQGLVAEVLNPEDFHKVKDILFRAVETDQLHRDQFGLNPILFDLQTAVITAEEIGLNRASIISILLHNCVSVGVISMEDVGPPCSRSRRGGRTCNVSTFLVDSHRLRLWFYQDAAALPSAFRPGFRPLR